MLLAIDIGNTHIVLGVFDRKHLRGEWRVATQLHKTSDEYGILTQHLLAASKINSKRIAGAIIASVVPPLTPVFHAMTQTYFSKKVITINHALKTGIRILYDQPNEIGADRIVNAAAAYHLFGGPLVIIDFGTATTFCVLSKSGDYLGGAIAPGLMISAEALHTRTAKLAPVELNRPASVIGKNTLSSIQSGLIFGYAGLVDGLVNRIHTELGAKTEVIATGGLCGLLTPECRTITKMRPTLTLEGLMIIYGMNRG